MKVPREERGLSAPRTLSMLQADLLLFQTEGKGDLRLAKNHNNVISEYFFTIQLSQVILQTSKSALRFVYSGMPTRSPHHTWHLLSLVVSP